MSTNPSPSSFRWYYQRHQPGSGLGEALEVAASVGGGPPHVFQVDTGSCGVAIGRSQVAEPFDQPDPNLPTSTIHYMPSGIQLSGQWTPNVPVTLLNPDGAPQQPAATVTMTVLIVDEPVEFAGGHGGMLGVGYHTANLLLNPLMQVVLGDGPGGQPLSAGYILTLDYVEVGLTDQNQAGFQFASLQPAANNEWMGPNASVSLSGGPLFPTPATLQLPMLVDTGVDLMMIFADPAGLPPAWASASQADPVHVDLGQVEVSVAMPASGPPLVSYTFGGGKAALQEPSEVLYMGGGSGLNTGIHVLRVHDYLFDSVTHRIGFRRRVG